MRTLPADVATKQTMLMTLSLFVRVFGQLERDLRAGGSDAELTPSAYAALAEVVTAERFPTLAPVFWAGAYTGDPAADPDDPVADDFDLGLELLLAGLAAHVAAHPPDGRTEPAGRGVAGGGRRAGAADRHRPAEGRPGPGQGARTPRARGGAGPGPGSQGRGALSGAPQPTAWW